MGARAADLGYLPGLKQGRLSNEGQGSELVLRHLASRSLSDLPDPATIVLEFAQIHPPLWRIFQYTPASDGGL